MRDKRNILMIGIYSAISPTPILPTYNSRCYFAYLGVSFPCNLLQLVVPSLEVVVDPGTAGIR